MTKHVTSASATRAKDRNKQNRLARPIQGQRSDRLVRALRAGLDQARADNPNNEEPRVFGYGVQKIDTTRVFREITHDRLWTVEVIAGEPIDGVIAYEVEGEGTGIVFNGGFPGQLRPDGGEVFSGRFKNNGTLINLFDGTHTATDSFLVSQTAWDVDAVGTNIAYFTARFTFIQGRFNGDPNFQVYARMRRAVDPRDVDTGQPLPAYASLARSFTVNPYRMLFDFLTKPVEECGAGLPLSSIDVDSFATGADWAETKVATQEFTKTALLTTRTNQQTGTPPIQTNHLLEFDVSVLPFDYGDIVNIIVGTGQSLPSGLSAGVDYHVIPIRYAVGDFQIPAMALAESFAGAMNGVSIAQGTRTSDIDVKKVGEARFTTGITYTSEETPLDIVRRMLESCAARIYLDNGRIAITRNIFPGVLEQVIEDELTGDVALSNRRPLDDTATEIVGSYQGLTTVFKPTPYPLVDAGGIYRAQDLDIANPARLDFATIPKGSVAQRVALIALRLIRQGRTLSFSGTLNLYRLKPGTVFYLDQAKLGLDINTTWQVLDQDIFVQLDGDRFQIGVDIVARQLEAETFDLTASDESLVSSIEIPGLQSPFEVGVPGVPVIVESLFVARQGGGLKNRLDVSWAASIDTFVRGYVFSYKATAGSTFTFQPETPDLSVSVIDLAPDAYDFRVRAINSFSLESEDAVAEGVEILGLAALPSDPTGFRGDVVGSANVILQWDLSPDLDVTEGGSVEIRHDPDIAGGNSADSTLLATGSGSSTLASVPFRIGNYYLRFIDSTGQVSAFVQWSTQNRRPVPLAQIVSGGNLIDAVDDTVFTIAEDPTFPSTNLNNTLIVDSNKLLLPGEDNWDDVVDVDAVPDVDEVGAGSEIASEGFYFFSTAIELNAASRVLLEAVIATEIFDSSANVDDIVDVDAVSDFDAIGASGAQAAQATSDIEARVSRDTIASATFGPWESLRTEIFFHRSFEFRVRSTSLSPTVNIRVVQARIRARDVSL